MHSNSLMLHFLLVTADCLIIQFSVRLINAPSTLLAGMASFWRGNLANVIRYVSPMHQSLGA